MKKLVACALVLVAAGCASTKTKDDAADDIVPRAQTIEQAQTAATEQRLEALQTSMTELLDRLDVMNSRLAKLEAGVPTPVFSGTAAPPPPQSPIVAAVPAPAPVVAAQPASASNPLAGAQLADTYRNALMLVGRGKLDDARRTFQKVFDDDPTGDLADNALFWIGETYFAASNYSEAVKYYKRVTVEFSEQNKAPDALFKIALAFEKTSDLGMAKKTLDEVIQRYPYSSAAASAKQELKRIRY